MPMKITPEQREAGRAKAKEALLAAKAEREATTKVLPGGAKVYRDSPPGTGFVLEFPEGGRKHYYMTSAVAVSMWEEVWSKDYGLAETA